MCFCLVSKALIILLGWLQHRAILEMFTIGVRSVLIAFVGAKIYWKNISLSRLAKFCALYGIDFHPIYSLHILYENWWLIDQSA